MEYNFTYDSSTTLGEKEYSMEREYYNSPILPYRVLFVQEGVVLTADADGNAVFCNMEGAELFRDKADGQGRYFSSFYCKVKDGVISLRFPIQEVVDHYPNCDGEYDRYSYITRDNVVFHYTI